jgi:hypothetical protein
MQKINRQSKIHGEPERALKIGLGFIGAAGAGAALMYFLDPRWGRRRRVLARDQMNRIRHQTADAVGATSRDLRNRAYGIMAETRNLVSRKQVSDQVLAERVRARLGSLVSDASAVQVWCENGRITLSGGIVAAELPRLVRGVASIRGVTGVENHMTVNESSESVGPQDRSGWYKGALGLDVLQRPWSTMTRLLAGTLGASMALAGAARRNLNGATIAVIGIATLARALGDTRLLQFTGMSGRGSNIEEGGRRRPGTRNGEGAAQ